MKTEEKKPEVKIEAKQEENGDGASTTSPTQFSQTFKKSKDVFLKLFFHPCLFVHPLYSLKH